jgi:DNA-directed RNA polymerase subunit RPC12/RpoP
MDTEEVNEDPILTHVHRCISCGARTRRSQLSGRDALLGLYECPACGNKGPLNVEIADERLISDGSDKTT